MRRLTRRRQRSEITEIETVDHSSRNEYRGERTGQDSIPIDVGGNSGTQQHQNDSSEQSSSVEQSEESLFHPTAASQTPDDPLIRRIGTMATITFTYETDLSANPEESIVAGVNGIASTGGLSPRHALRPSSMVWRDQGGELVVTVLGTNRVRLICSMKDEKSTRG